MGRTQFYMSAPGQARITSAKSLTTSERLNAVLRLLRGESAATISTDLGVASQRLERWQNEFVAGGSAGLAKSKSSHPGGWLSKHTTAIFQWVALLIVLAFVIRLMQSILQRGGGE